MDLSRIDRMLGPDAVARLRAASACVFGLGGVGSFAAEALVRSGIGRVCLVDYDVVDPSNINRQIPALSSTVGRSKAAVMERRLRDINPDCALSIVTERYRPGDFDRVWSDGFDGLIDAVDDVPAKLDLYQQANDRSLRFISVLGTGGKLAPELLRLVDISETYNCPLARRLRKRLGRMGIRRGIRTVFSPEQPKTTEPLSPIPGSMTFVPASAGLLAASALVRDLLARGNQPTDTGL